MPVYIFENPNTGETIEIIQKMNDPHVYADNDGLEWNRVFQVPNASTDTEFNADMTESEFVRKTGGKNGTMGDLWDASAELSSKRAAKYGKDKVKDNFFKNYSKDRKGLKHTKDTKTKKIDSKHWSASSE